MDGDALGERAVGDRQLEPGLAREADVVRRAQDEDARFGERRPQLPPLGDGRRAERRGAGLERGAPALDGAVAVPVGLDDGPELGSRERVEEPPRVPAERAEVDRDR